MQTDDPQLHYELIDTRARPARIAVLINSSDADWRYTAVRIIEVLCSVWGGRHSVIIPTDGSKIEPVFWDILERFSPDYVYFYCKTGGDIQNRRPDDYATLLQEHIKRFESTNNTVVSADEKDRIDGSLRKAPADRFNVDTNLSSQIADRLVPFHYNRRVESLRGHGYVPRQLASITNVLPYVAHAQSFVSFQVTVQIDELWWAAHTGVYSASCFQQLLDLGLNKETIRVSEGELCGFARWVASGAVDKTLQEMKSLGYEPGFIPPDETRPTPFDISMSRIGLYGSPLSHDAVAERFALVVGDSIADFCLAYCFRRVGHGAAWLPSPWLKQLQPGYQGPLRSCIAAILDAAPHEVKYNLGLKVCSVSLDAQSISEVLEELKNHVALGLNGEVVNACEAVDVVRGVGDAPIPYCIDSPNQSEIYPFLGDRSIGAIQTPRPNGFSKLSASKHRWVAELRAGGQTVPTVPHVAANFVILPQSVGTVSTRVSQGALAYACPGIGLIIGDDITPNLQKPEIRLFDTFTAVSFMAKANGFECQLSDKGIYQRDSLEKLGGISRAAKLLREDGSRAVLRKFLDHTKPKPGTHDEGCVLHGRTYLDFGTVQKVMGGGENAAVTLLDTLTAARVTSRGFALGCAVCKHADWYSLAGLADDFRCTRCGRKQTIRREHWRHPAAPQIFYKLDEIVYQFLRSDGDVVILSLDYMSRHSKDPFNFSPEIQLRKYDSTFNAEIDFCAVWHGMLSIGEAKKQGELASSDSDTRKTIEKYVRLASMFNARKVLFCTTSPKWRSTTIEAVEREFRGALAVPVFLAAAEILDQ